jgi:phage repressor protein C with HTH and peptisase S24 domain
MVYGVDMKENSVTDRLKTAMESKNVSKADLARAANVTPQAAGRWFKTNSISKSSLSACARFLDVSITWLLDGVDTVPGQSAESNAAYAGTIDPWDSKTPLNEDDVEVPFYTEVELSAGSGSIVQKQNKGPKLRFSKSTLKRQGVEIDNAACVSVRGNSMEPVIPDGACVGIDTSKTEIKDGDMYAIDWHGELYVKTLTRKPGGGLRIRSFNIDEYPDENLNKDDTKHVKVIGRVFWYSVLR